MKSLILCVAMAVSSIGYSQELTIKSSKLDSLIFKEVNLYRKSIGVRPIAIFDMGQLRTISYVLTDLNSARPVSEFDHTRDNLKLFVGFNSECIYSYQVQSSSSDLTNQILTDFELDLLAKRTVQAWIDSPNHNYLIASILVKSCAITSAVVIKNNTLRLVVSYHDRLSI